MKYLRIIGVLAAIGMYAAVQATPPIDYTVAVRNSEGHVLADAQVKFLLEIVDKTSGGKVLYSEKMPATTGPDGMAHLFIGEGEPIEGDYHSLDWSMPRYLAVHVDVDGSGNYRKLGTMQLLGAPRAVQAATASTLVCTNSTGDVMELTVNDLGELQWKVREPESDEPQYDLAKVPEHLYFTGTYNNWKVAEAEEMTKLSPYKFTIDRHLVEGEIFKFVPQQEWGVLDWSGTAAKIDVAVALREFLNTPPFPGPEGDYTITVDFYKYTLLITSKK